MKQLSHRYDSPVGPLFLVATAKGLSGIYWRRPRGAGSDLREPTDRRDLAGAKRILARAKRQLGEYFAKKRKNFDLPLHFAGGTVFQRKVWAELARIPYGRTVSYRDLARRIHHERAVRAVGSANGRNPFSIVMPCHRVIASNGTLGGYAGGLKAKSRLLAIERLKARKH
ncbi:MAG: methylated-DNA--[protein]-cysteine S-methyltransferase [Bacteriovoracia bacterium]